MKRTLKIILASEALVCLLICGFLSVFENLFVSLFTFPFGQLGMGLRLLSTASTMGNVISIVIYCTFNLLPAGYFIFRAYKRRIYAEDGLLVLMSIVLFPVIYLMINPAYIGRHFGAAEFIEANKAFLGVVVYSIMAGYSILRGLRVFTNSETGSILKYLKILLFVICVVLVYDIFGLGLTELVSSFKQLSAGNTDQGQNLNFSYVFLVLQYLVNSLPSVLEILVIFSGLELIGLLEKDPYGEGVPGAARKIGRICRYSVAAIMLSQIGVNVLQLVLGSLVRSSHYTLSIPILSVVFVLAAMLFAGYFEQAIRFKDDNDMFI